MITLSTALAVGFVLNFTNSSLHELSIDTWVKGSPITANHSKSHWSVEHLEEIHGPDFILTRYTVNYFSLSVKNHKNIVVPYSNFEYE